MGLPRLLPPALRRRPAALAGAALPDAADAARRRRCRWRSGEASLLEIVFGVLFAVGVVAWSATALIFGRVPALASAVLLLVYPAWATLYHQASSDAVFATGLALWALVLARTLRWPSTLGVRRARARHRGPRPDPAREPGPAARAFSCRSSSPSPWRRRLTWVAVCLAAAVLPLAGWAVHNGVRYDDATVARGGRAWVPFLKVWLDDRTIAPENGAASRRLADLIERHVLDGGAVREPPRAARRVPRERLELRDRPADRALRPRPRQRRRTTSVLFDSAIEAIRAHPRTYVRGVADVFWQFLMQAPIREGIAPRAQTEPAPPPPTFTRDGVVLPEPAGDTSSSTPCPYGFVWCASDYIDSCTLDDPSRRLERREDAAALPGGRLAGAGLGCRAPVPRTGVAWVTEILEPDHAALPPAAALARRRRRRAPLAAAARAGGRSSSSGAPRPPCSWNPRRLAGRRARVRAPALSALHRDRARRARG